MELVGRVVLIVDDDQEVAGLIGNTLTYGGATVIIASSIRDGLAALRAGKFDLILLDYVISEKVAEQFLAKAILTGAGSTIPVIIVSGHGENLAMDRFRDYPQVKAVLSKPFEPGVLLELAAKAVR